MNNFNNILTKTESLTTLQGGIENSESGKGGGYAGHLQAIYYWDSSRKNCKISQKKERAISSDHP